MVLKIVRKIANVVSKRLRHHRGKKFADGIEKITNEFHRELNNVNFDMEANGELRVLKIISERSPVCIFDVGANNGDWSALVSGMNKQASIHAFELVPSTYDIFLQKTKELKNIIPNNFGLSNIEETITINVGSESVTATAFKIEGMKFHNEYYKAQLLCKVKKAVDYINEKQIHRVDFLKIDVEGMDLRVIKGFEEKIDIVKSLQFEYGIFNISSHDLLADFCNYLANHGFVVGKIFPNYVNFFDYHFDMENFHGSNFIAVKKEEATLIKNLATQKYQSA